MKNLEIALVVHHGSQLKLAHGRKGKQPPRILMRKHEVKIVQKDPV